MQQMSEALVAGSLEHIRELERYQPEPEPLRTGNRKERRAQAAMDRRADKRARSRGTVDC